MNDSAERSVFSHLCRSTFAGFISGVTVAAPAILVWFVHGIGLHFDPVQDTVLLLSTAAVAGTAVGIVAGIVTFPWRNHLPARQERQVTKIVSVVVALPAGITLFPLWVFSTTSSVLFVAAMSLSVVYAGAATFVAAKTSVRFVFGSHQRRQERDERNKGDRHGR